MKRTTERKWHSWLNGVALTTCPSMWRRQRRLWWTSGETLLTTPHTTQRTSPGPPTPSLSPRRHNSAYTFSAGWKGQASLHPSSPPSTGVPLSVLTSCITVWYGNCSAADRKTLQRTVNTLQKSWCPSPLHPGYFPYTMLQQSKKYRGGPHPPLPQSLPAPTLR